MMAPSSGSTRSPVTWFPLASRIGRETTGSTRRAIERAERLGAPGARPCPRDGPRHRGPRRDRLPDGGRTALIRTRIDDRVRVGRPPQPTSPTPAPSASATPGPDATSVARLHGRTVAPHRSALTAMHVRNGRHADRCLSSRHGSESRSGRAGLVARTRRIVPSRCLPFLGRLLLPRTTSR